MSGIVGDPTIGPKVSRIEANLEFFTAERRKAKMLNFSIAHGKTDGFNRDWMVNLKEYEKMVELWYKDRPEVLTWQEQQKLEAQVNQCVTTLLGRICRFPIVPYDNNAQKDRIDRAAIRILLQGSAADVIMCAMLEIDRSVILKGLGWELLLQVGDQVILEGPKEWSETAKATVTECMLKPFNGRDILSVDLSVHAKCAQNWYAATD